MHSGTTSAGERGYLEGYYGRLLTWQERRRLIDHLAALKFGTYFYAPKEDVYHRLNWREPYPAPWRDAFADFCGYAQSRGIKVVAGVAPGLDFDFAHLTPQRSDFDRLLEKSQKLLEDGVTQLALLLDDIDEDFLQRRGRFSDEGTAHAELANQLAEATGKTLWVVPRVYANEIAVEAPGYLPAFDGRLQPKHSVVYCGSHTVAPSINSETSAPQSELTHPLVFWDNLYANDYCPRRLFVGEWLGRQRSLNILLNPVGMIETDLLLLSVMAAGDHTNEPMSEESDDTMHQNWRSTLQQAGVPDAFFEVAPFFMHPPRPDGLQVRPMEYASARQLDALETLLWKWKSPLSREWNPFLMSLKHDLLLATDGLPLDRIVKTQSNPLAARLVHNTSGDNNNTADCKITPASGVGAYVENIDLSVSLNEALLSQLRTALGNYGVLFFRNQALEPEHHIALAKQFGEININRFFHPVDDYPQIAEVRKEPDQKTNIGSMWHTDHSYDVVPAMGSILVTRETPSKGGDTVFTNMISVCDVLSGGLRSMLENMSAVHSSRHVFGAAAKRYDTAAGKVDQRIGNEDAATQDAVHPVIIKHPISGKAVLYINPQFTTHFDGWTVDESRPLLDYLYNLASRHDFTHRFQWESGSVAFWDNRATWHYAINDYHGERRLMHRVTVEGDTIESYR